MAMTSQPLGSEEANSSAAAECHNAVLKTVCLASIVPMAFTVPNQKSPVTEELLRHTIPFAIFPAPVS
jgi:hypothetical protein